MSAKTCELWVALGSNLGDRGATLDGAVECLRGAADFEVLGVSEWIETEPQGGPAGQGLFLNGVLKAASDLGPEGVLALLQATEQRFGRQRVEHHGPRTLDLDLLLYGQAKRASASLSLPHPGLEERLFVLQPMLQLAPQLRLPASGMLVAERVAWLKSATIEDQAHVH